MPVPHHDDISRLNERPTMEEFIVLKSKGGKNPVRIIDRIGTKYTELCTLLLQDEDGELIKTIVKDEKGITKDITREILRRWLSVGGAQATWKVLVDVLMKVEQQTLADDIVAALQPT